MARILSCIVGAVACLCLVPRDAVAQSAKAWADSTTFVVGDPITVHVELSHPSNAKPTALVGDTLGAFHILSRDSLNKSNETTTTTSFTIAAYDSGTAILPPLEFAYSLTNDSTMKRFGTNILIFTIRLVEVDTAKGIKDIKPVLSIPYTVAEISLVIGTLVGIALAIHSFVRYRKRKKARTPEEKYIPPPKAAHIIALEELALLKEKRLWQQGLIKPYYSEVTEVVRRYFENRFRFMSLEKTTDETMDDLRRHTAAHTILEPSDRILRLADLVKFAKYEPTIPDHEAMMALAFEIIDKTKVVELSRPTADMKSEKREVKETANV